MLAFEDLAIVLLSEEAVEVIAEFNQGAAGIDETVELGEIWVLGPNLSGFLDLFLSFFSIAFLEA